MKREGGLTRKGGCAEYEMSRLGLMVRRSAGKRKDVGSTPRSGSPLNE